MIDRTVIPDRRNTAGIVVTFNPDHSMHSRLATLAQQVSEFVVIDNGSRADIAALVGAATVQSNGHFIGNQDNLGIAAALNQGANWAGSRGHTWLLTLDQDTEISAGMVATLAQLHRTYPSKDRLAVVGANFSDALTGKTVLKSRYATDRPWFASPTAITSGSLISIPALRTIGPFREDFFIDHVDTEYCLRARRLGYQVIVSAAPLMVHSIGKGSMTNVLGRMVWTSNHTALRRYYNARNAMTVAGKYLDSDFGFVVQILLHLCKSILLIVLLEEAKLAKLRSIMLGITHGFRGRLGKFEAEIN